MSWSKWIRLTHRWLSVAFTVAVIVNGVAVAEKKYTNSLGLVAVFTLALQFFTGVYLFVLPYGARHRTGQRTDQTRGLISCALGNYQRNIIGLFVRAESSKLI